MGGSRPERGQEGEAEHEDVSTAQPDGEKKGDGDGGESLGESWRLECGGRGTSVD